MKKNNAYFAFILIMTASLVGCKNDGEPPVIPDSILITSAVEEVTDRSAVVKGIVVLEGTVETIDAQGLAWGTSAGPTVDDNVEISTEAVYSEMEETLECLDVNTMYYVRAYATKAGTTFYGNEESFTTEDPTPPSCIYDANTFNLGLGDISMGAPGCATMTDGNGTDWYEVKATGGIHRVRFRFNESPEPGPYIIVTDSNAVGDCEAYFQYKLTLGVPHTVFEVVAPGDTVFIIESSGTRAITICNVEVTDGGVTLSASGKFLCTP